MVCNEDLYCGFDGIKSVHHYNHHKKHRGKFRSQYIVHKIYIYNSSYEKTEFDRSYFGKNEEMRYSMITVLTCNNVNKETNFRSIEFSYSNTYFFLILTHV